MAMIQGKAFWAKVVGKPVKGYNEGDLEWSIDVAVDAAARKKLVELGLEEKIKNKGDDRGDFINFKRRARKKDGTESKPIKIVDKYGKDWDGALIGNGSIVNVKFAVNEWEFGKKSGVRADILALQVWDLVEYADKEPFPVAEGGEEDWSGEDE